MLQTSNDPLQSSQNSLTAQRLGDQWLAVASERAFTSENTVAYLQQVVVSLDGPVATSPAISIAAQEESIAQSHILEQVDSFHQALTKEIPVAEGNVVLYDPDLCYRASPGSSCFIASYLNSSTSVHTPKNLDTAFFPTSRSTVLTYAFALGTEDKQKEWLAKLHQTSDLTLVSYTTTMAASPNDGREKVQFTPVDARSPGSANHRSILSPANNKSSEIGKGLGISLRFSPPSYGTNTRRDTSSSLREMRNVRWMAYAAKAFFMRFWRLVKVSTFLSTRQSHSLLRKCLYRMQTLLIYALCWLPTSSCMQRSSIYSSICDDLVPDSG